MPKAEARKSYHHGDLRRALLEASVQLIHERGVETLSLREVARRAGVSAAAPYHHFANKAELLGALAADGFDALYSAMTNAIESLADTDDSIARLSALGHAYIQTARTRPVEFRLMFRPGLVSRHDLPERCEPDRSFNLLQTEVARVANDLPGQPVSPEGIAILAWSVVHGASELALEGSLDRTETEPAIEPAQIGPLAVDSLGAILRALQKTAP